MALPTPLYALVLEAGIRPTKAGDRFYYALLIKTNSGQIKANMWDAHKEAAKDPDYPHVNDVIKINKFKDQLATHKSIVISPLGFERIAKEDLPEDEKELCEFPKADPERLKWALKLISDKSLWEDEKHYNFVNKCLSKLDRNKLMSCPAASAIHHNYSGGLLVHTAEVLDLCRAIYESCKEPYGFINRDVLYAGAILHDIGKVETYFITEAGLADQLATEQSIGHIFYGMDLVKNVGESEGIEQDFINEVIHLIASHHGKIEWGSYRPTQSQEATILSSVDLISSRNGKIESRLKENVKLGQPLRDSFDIYKDWYFASIGMKQYVEAAS